ncbi:sigma-70 family RNA polymerase sigma factor [Cellulomonas oligotrophica]|uniref:RNA polymerase sigma factor n=1 Tax=Cellulomonas oligotrophica TaxID=931536 RepID=A0A7Y9JZV0_9CELL|nr:sigma-70 family RNA polymerase sigma factor [Cellulomonas oligotrophica]NYD86630.1 RNA polymerase sigma factor (sigma-70 family) [Cellulomonas oligotrophica]GIG34391.1 RNA polymerase sigma factor [Cellulomonas oligotrophica]
MTHRWEDALDALVKERYGALVARAALLTRATADAQDLVHDALVATFTARARFDSVEQAEAYVRRAIATRFVDGHRRRLRELKAVGRVAQMIDGEAYSDVAEHLDADLVDALAELSPRERVCVLLRHLDDLSVRETASVLGLSEGAVKRYTSDGVAALQARLGTTVDSDDSDPVHLIVSEGGPRD